MLKKLLLLLALILTATPAIAADITACASGCTHPTLQAAIDAAAFGDRIILKAGEVYTAPAGGFILKDKSGTESYITIRSSGNPGSMTIVDSNLPAAGIRLTAGPSPIPDYRPFLAKIKPLDNNDQVFKTEVLPAVTSYWRLQFLDIEGNTYGGSDLIRLGTTDTTQNLLTEIPHHFEIDRVLLHGLPTVGVARGIGVHARDITIKDSTCTDVWLNGFESQCIFVGNSDGGTNLIENNYIASGSQYMLFGGVNHSIRVSTTVAASPAPTTTSATLTACGELIAGSHISFSVTGQVPVTRITTISTIVGCAITFPALPAAPDVPGAVIAGHALPEDWIVKRNHMSRPLAWRNPIVATPTSPGATGSISGGTLIANTYGYKIVARHPISLGNTASSTPATEVTGIVTTGTTGSVSLTWTSVALATEYRVYGRTPGGQNIYFVVSDAAGCTGTIPNRICSFTDTGGAGTAGTPTSTGTVRTVKTGFEVKYGRRITLDGNLIENVWKDGQVGFAILIKIANTTQTHWADSDTITITNNVVRHAAGGINMDAEEYDCADDGLSTPCTGHMNDVIISNNLFYDIKSTWGSSSQWLLVQRGPTNLTVTNNTSDHAGGSSVSMDPATPTITNFIARNLMTIRSGSGWKGGGAEGTDSLAAHAPGYIFQRIVIAGGTSTRYPTGQCPSFNCYPTTTVWQAEFTDYAAAILAGGASTSSTIDAVGDISGWVLHATSTYKNGGTDGADIGFNRTTLETAIRGAVAVPLNILTTSVPDGTRTVAYTPQTFQATGGTPPYSWSNFSGTPPAGTTFVNGVLSGTPSGFGVTTWTVRVTDNVAATDNQSITITVHDAPLALSVITTTPLNNATRNQAYSQTLNATGGTGSYTWSVQSGTWPAGLNLAANGVLSGTPTEIGLFTVTVAVTDTFPTVAPKTLQLTVLSDIAPPPPPQENDPEPISWNGTEVRIYRRPTAPTAIDRPRHGYLWLDTSSSPPSLKAVTGLDALGEPTFSPMGGSRQFWAMLGTQSTWTNMPAALNEWRNPTSSEQHRIKLDLTGCVEVRLTAVVNTVGSVNAKVFLQYSTNESAWTTIATDLNIFTTGLKVSSWIALPIEARTDIFLRLAGSDADGVADPVLAQGMAVFR